MYKEDQTVKEEILGFYNPEVQTQATLISLLSIADIAI
jgi:hypothetical protein